MSLLLTRADARHLPFAPGCVQTVVTSPPYWGLRDYGIADQIGLEATPDAYVADLVAVFREVWRVLRDDGTVWLNLGDSYAGSWGAQSRGAVVQCDGLGVDRPNTSREVEHGHKTQNAGSIPVRSTISNNQIAAHPKRTHTGSWVKDHPTLKPKDLVGIPWRVAFALQADGWYLRSDIIWAKLNPMPESVTDRPTKAHEYVFLLTKAARYYYNSDVVREQIERIRSGKQHNRVRNVGGRTDGFTRGEGGAGFNVGGTTRNLRSVWNISTQPYPGAHFATMPEKLVERCVLAGSKAGDVVLDPFMGSGTVGRVALNLGRRAIGCDLNPEYLTLAQARTRVTLGLPLTDEGAA